MFFGIQFWNESLSLLFFSLNGGRERKMNDRKTKICLYCGGICRMEVFFLLYLTEENGGYYDKFRLTFTFNMIEFYMGKV
jgi:hypothetical protein